MTRGRKPRPAHLKLLEGNPGKRRVPVGEPRPPIGPVPEAPGFLATDARAEWDRVSTSLYHMGLLTDADVAPLAAYCQAYGRWVAAERVIAAMAEKDQVTGGLMIKTTNGNAIQNPLVGTANTAARDMLRFASEFGLTPVARARLALGALAPQGSIFDGLIPYKNKFDGLV
jgi:P27 family predicted phage terminase small subunit